MKIQFKSDPKAADVAEGVESIKPVETPRAISRDAEVWNSLTLEQKADTLDRAGAVFDRETLLRMEPEHTCYELMMYDYKVLLAPVLKKLYQMSGE